MSKLAALKRKSGANLKKLQEKLEQQSQGGAPRDERIWKPKFNREKGKGTAEVRFLTPKEGDPFVEVKSYSFNGPGGNYYDLAISTLGEDDPIQIAAISAFRKAKADGDETLRNYAKKFLPRSNYYANVVVIKDEEAPENEGKVFIYEFGRQVFGFIEKLIKPEFDDIDPSDPFDFWEGRNFRIRMIGKEIPDSRTGKKILVPNYESSEFLGVSEFLDGNEEEIEKIYNLTHNLNELIDPKRFKSFDDVAARFHTVTGKPYNWLSSAGVEEHIQTKEKEVKLNQEQDNDDGSDDYRENDDTSNDDTDMSDGGGDEEESPVEKFRRLAGKK